MSSVTQTPGTVLRLKTRDSNSVDRDLPYPLATIRKPWGTRETDVLGKTIFLEDFSNPNVSMHNDGKGSAHRTCDVTFDSFPTVMLDAQGNIATGSDPGSVPNTGGVVFKRRVVNRVNGKVGYEHWIYFSGSNLTSATRISTSIYIRDGTNINIGRIWYDLAATDISIKYLQSDGTYTIVTSYPWNRQVTYDPSIGNEDKAGEWNYVKLVIDFDKKEYVSFQWNEVLTSLAGKAIRSTADTAARNLLHFSHEMFQTDSARLRTLHLALPHGTRE